MAMTPEVVFPKTIVVGGVKLGRVYYSEYTAGTFKRWFNVTDCAMLDLSDIRADTHISPATGLPFNLMIFPNLVKLQIRFYCYPSGDDVLLRCAVGHESNGVWTQLAGSRGEVSLGPNYRVLDAAVKGVKVTYNLVYPVTSAVEDITKAAYFCLYMFAPVKYTYEGENGIQDWGHIMSDMIYQYEYAGGVPQNWNDGTSIMYDAPGTFPVDFYAWDDLTQLQSLLNSIKPLDGVSIFGDPIDPEQPSQDENPSVPGGGGGEGGEQIPGGGNGYDPKSDEIEFPVLPTNGAVDCGAVKTFVVSKAILTSLFNRLWNTGIFDITTWQKLLEAPLDSLIGLQCVPITPAAPNTDTIYLGSFNTLVDAPVVTTQYYTIDCGECKINEFFGSALDYTNTRVEIYLPFIGVRELETSDVMNMLLSVKYNYDIITGDLVANIKCGKSVLYKFPGNVKSTIPVSSRTNTQIEQMLRIIPSAAVVAGAGGAGAAAAIASNAINIAMSKRIVQRSGDISGSAGLLDEFTPYIILHRPMLSLAASMRSAKGYRSNITATLSSLSGYTEVEYIHLTGIDGATDTELSEIEALLKKGVII